MSSKVGLRLKDAFQSYRDEQEPWCRYPVYNPKGEVLPKWVLEPLEL